METPFRAVFPTVEPVTVILSHRQLFVPMGATPDLGDDDLDRT